MAFPDLAALRDFAGWKSAREPRAAGPAPDQDALRRSYLDLLKLTLCDLAGSRTTSVSLMIDGVAASRELAGEDRRFRAAGLDWPLHGLTMVGLNRLDDLQACVESVVRDDVPGDLIEAGAWRGGASMLMRATLDTLGAGRAVVVADSFAGFPADEARGHLGASDFLAVPLDEVRDSFARLGLADGVRFLPGFFAETLPDLAGGTWSLVRLDGDTYEATRLALDVLYPGLSVGGHLVVDDYGAMGAEECKRAVDEFRERHDITEPLEPVDWTSVRWRRTSAELADPPVPPRPPAPHERAQPASAKGLSHVPTGRERDLAHELRLAREELAETRAEVERLRAPRSWRERLAGRPR